MPKIIKIIGPGMTLEKLNNGMPLWSYRSYQIRKSTRIGGRKSFYWACGVPTKRGIRAYKLLDLCKKIDEYENERRQT